MRANHRFAGARIGLLCLAVLSVSATLWVGDLEASFVPPEPPTATLQESQLGLPETPQNLQVLPEMSTRALIGVMRGFASGLGVRCIHCHVGDDPNDLSTTDFISDTKETKRIARVMMRMVNTVNESELAALGEFGRGAGQRAEVGCATCHHGNAKPTRLEDELGAAYASGGYDALAARYDALRERFYGGWTYDFSIGVLNGTAEQLAAAGNVDDAIAVVDKNIALHPGEVSPFFTKFQIHQRAGNIDGAREALRGCIAIGAPGSAFCQQQLDQLEQQ